MPNVAILIKNFVLKEIKLFLSTEVQDIHSSSNTKTYVKSS